ASLLRLNESRTIDTTGYEWDAGANRWRRVASPVEQRSPFSLAARPLAAAPAIRLDDAHLLLFSGATGRYVTLDVQDRPNFPNDYLIYDARSDVWQLGGLMPAGVVTTTAVEWQGRIVIPSGEIRPGVRTPRVQSLDPANALQ
ncbi:MAG: hypothetical protein R3B90_18220, partial [Planctomycetaceae bacterium]